MIKNRGRGQVRVDVNEEFKFLYQKNRGSGGGGGWVQGEYAQRFEVFVKMPKKFRGVRADVNEELKLLWKCKKKYRGWGMSGPAGDRGGGRGLVASNVWGRG